MGKVEFLDIGMKMRERIVYTIELILIISLMLISTTIAGAKKEKTEYQEINSTHGYALFHEQTEGDSIADVYTPKEAINKMQKLQSEISSKDYFYYYSNISIKGIDDIKIVGAKMVSELSPFLLEGNMISDSYHITDMSKIIIPSLIGENLKNEYEIGDVVTGVINGVSVSLQIVGVLNENCYNENIDADFSTFTIPELYFDCEGVTEKELETQEWILNSTISGYLEYNSVDEYVKYTEKFNNISDSLGLEWKVEKREVNRFATIDVNVPVFLTELMFWSGMLSFVLVVFYHLKKNIHFDKGINLIESSRVIWIENINIIVAYFAVYSILQLLLMGSVYKKNLREESGTVLFAVTVYLIFVSIMIGMKGYRHSGNITNRD